MNKKYVWTTGPKSLFQSAMKAGYNANKLARTESEDSTNPVSEQGVLLSGSPDGTLSRTSMAPSLNGVETSVTSTDFGWDHSLITNSRPPATAIVKEKTKSLRGPQTNGFTAGYTPDLVGKTKNKNQPISPSETSGIAAWVSAARNGLPEITRPRLPPIPSGTLIVLDKNEMEVSVVSKGIAVNGQCKDVNAFETNNAAEWDEERVGHGKSLDRNDMKDVFEEKAENAEKMVLRESRIVKPVIRSSLPHTPPFSPPLEDRIVKRTATVTRSTRRGTQRELRDQAYIPPLPKTKTCWFWAESVGGCRYRPEECLNLHVKPKPGMLPNYPLKDGKPTWGCLADATPQEVPEGKRPRSCWYWATKGVCEHGTACNYVHGWVKGGVAPRPQHMVISSDEEDSDDSEEEDDDHVVLSGQDIGDKAPSQAINMTPGFIASRVYALGGSTKTVIT
ncbi:hypothetical protein EPUL_003297 [Erysiphe pulchra]|uniref:C3H1-type domain-containing protein n=1 Tax=Erysiphe pulchra TaxID=225359 RepID=A0A2S4PVX5_9PEZI|nr:hypothetical protein EPUL_003297 [Erysiphe pulchra]